MLIVNDFIISDPCFRDIITSNLSPSLASTTLIVSITIVMYGLKIIEYIIADGAIRIRDNITPSSINRDISRWFWWIISEVIIISGKINMISISWFDIENIFQDRDVKICLWFTRPMLLNLAFDPSNRIGVINYDTQSHCFYLNYDLV